MKRGATRHPKVRLLAERLKIEPAHAIGILELLWHYTTEFYPDGDIGRAPNKVIAEAVLWRKNANTLIEALKTEGWLDAKDGNKLLVHDWPIHAEDSVHMKIARAKKFFADGSAPKTNRLSGKERADSVTFYEKTCAHAVRYADGREGTGPGLALISSSSIENTEEEKIEVSTTKKSPQINPQAQRQILDEQFQGFRNAYDFTNRATTEADWDHAHSVWKLLDFEQKLAALSGIKREAGNSMVYKPKRYLSEKEWTRKQSPPPIPQQKKRAIDFI